MSRLIGAKCAAIVLACSVGFMSANVQAASNAQLEAQIHQLMQRTQRLQTEVVSLQAQLHHRARGTKLSSNAGKRKAHHLKYHNLTKHSQHSAARRSLYDMTRFHHSVTVTTSPFLGLRSAYDASDVLNQLSSVNEDFTLLRKRSQLEHILDEEGAPIVRPIIALSGGVAGQVFSQGGFNSRSTDGISLSSSELDMEAIVGNWASAFMSLDYDNTPVSQGNRAPRGEIYLRRGFVTIGDLFKSPFYVTIGEMYAPFGQFSSAMVSSPLTLSLARIRATVALTGYYNKGLNIIAFGYDGFQTSGGAPIFKQGGARIGYAHLFGNVQFAGSVSYVSNIADSEGMQANGLSLLVSPSGTITNFAGFAINPGGNHLAHNVPGIDGNAKLGIGDFTVIGEYVGAITTFNPADLTFNGSGAQPQALHTELDYSTHWWHKPVVLGIAYGHSWDALPLNLPENSFTGVFNISLWKNTIQAIEYRHDIDYSSSATSSGAGVMPVPPNNRGTGGTRNSVLAQIGVYF